MEQARFLVLVKRENMILADDHQFPIQKRYNREDQQEGECIWPPRSYACSFCKREFRSAQALGGHMNVHRRDRALLKQSNPHDQPLMQHPPAFEYHHQIDYRNLSSEPMHALNQSKLSQYSRASVTTKFSPSHKDSSSSSQSSCQVVKTHHYSVNKVRNLLGHNGDVVQPKELAPSRYCREEITQGDDHHGKEKDLSFKRYKKSNNNYILLPFLQEIKCSNLKVKSSVEADETINDLDLELRLGHSSFKVM